MRTSFRRASETGSGPCCATGRPVDSAAAQMEWSGSMDELAARRKTRRFARDPQDAESVQQDVLQR